MAEPNNKPFTLMTTPGGEADTERFRITPIPVDLLKHQNFLAEITKEMIDEIGAGNNRLIKTVVEVVDGVMRAGAPKKAPESAERKKFIKAASRVALPVVAKNFGDTTDDLAQKIAYEFMPKDGPSSNPDANLIAEDIKTAFVTDNYVRGKFAEKIKEQLIENRVELYRSIKIDASGVPEPERTYTPFEQAFKDMVGNVITKMAGIMPGTEKYKVITQNMVDAAGPEIKDQINLLKNSKTAGEVMAERLMEPKRGEEDLNTPHGQLAYEIRVQAAKKLFSIISSFATDDRIKGELAKTITNEMDNIAKEKGNNYLVALLEKESADAQGSKQPDTDLKKIAGEPLPKGIRPASPVQEGQQLKPPGSPTVIRPQMPGFSNTLQ